MKLIHKVSSGLLYGKYSYGPWPTPQVLADWDNPDVTNLVLSELTLNGGIMLRMQLINSYNLIIGVLRNNQVSGRSKVFIFTRTQPISGAPRFGIAAHVGDIDPSTCSTVTGNAPSGYSSTLNLQEIVSGSYVTLDSTSGVNVPLSTTVNCWFFVDGNSLEFFDDYTNLTLSASSVTLTNGQTGVWFSRWDSEVRLITFLAMTERFITVNGLSSGDTVEIRDRTDGLLTSASESGGSATLDLMEEVVTGCAKLVVVRSSIDYAQYTIGPQYWICGGDVFTIDNDISIIPEVAYAYMGRYLEHENNIFSAYTTAFGTMRVAAYNKLTGELTENVITGFADYYNRVTAPDITFDSSGYIYLAWIPNTDYRNINCWKSTNPYDISSFSSLGIPPASTDNLTYTLCFVNSTGRFFIFTREDYNSNSKWSVAYQDPGDWWYFTPVMVSTDSDVFLHIRQSTTNPDLLVCVVSWDMIESTNHSLKVFHIDLSNGDIIKPGTATPIGNFYSAAFDPALALDILTHTATEYYSCNDINEQGEIVFTQYNPASIILTAKYGYITYDHATGSVGTKKDIVTIGGTIHNSVTKLTFPGASFCFENCICLARYYDSEWLVEKWQIGWDGIWYSVRVDDDVDTDISSRMNPLTSALQQESSDIILYQRVKSTNPDYYISGTDLVIVETTNPEIPVSPSESTIVQDKIQSLLIQQFRVQYGSDL